MPIPQTTKYNDKHIHTIIEIVQESENELVFFNKNKYIQLNAIIEYIIPVMKLYKAENFKSFLYIQYINGTNAIQTRKKKLNF